MKRLPVNVGLPREVEAGKRPALPLVVTQPRMPCFNLGSRVGRPDMVKRFLDSRRSGFYLAVGTEGDLGAGDIVEMLEPHPAALSISELLRMYLTECVDVHRLRDAIAVPALPHEWRHAPAETAGRPLLSEVGCRRTSRVCGTRRDYAIT